MVCYKKLSSKMSVCNLKGGDSNVLTDMCSQEMFKLTKQYATNSIIMNTLATRRKLCVDGVCPVISVYHQEWPDATKQTPFECEA